MPADNSLDPDSVRQNTWPHEGQDGWTGPKHYAPSTSNAGHEKEIKRLEPEFYGDLVYKLKKIVGSNNFSVQFIKIISHYKKIGYNIYVLQQTACLVVTPITVGSFAFLFNCTPVGRTSDSMMVPT